MTEQNTLQPCKDIYAEVRAAILQAREHVYKTANTAMVQTYWQIGRIIVEHEQGGSERAGYGQKIIRDLAKRLTAEFGKGFNITNLKYMRQFYLAFPIGHAVSDQLSWTHYRMLLKVENEQERDFYAQECAKSGWSTRQLERQINSFYYQRLLASRDKEAVSKEIFEKEPAAKPEDFIKDPYVLEFVGLKQDDAFYEKELETALIGQLQKFMLEMGRGFAFVARQQHIDLDGEHFYIDLVFYNYLLKCFVLIDLKTTKLTHQDIGQMDTYVRLYDDLKRGEDDNPTIDLILCSEKNEAIARYSVLHDSKQIFAYKYQLTLPSKEELEHYLQIERHMENFKV